MARNSNSLDVLPYAESIPSSILSGITKVVLDAQKLVVLGKTVRAAHAAGLDLSSLKSNYEVGNEVVLGLSGAVGND